MTLTFNEEEEKVSIKEEEGVTLRKDNSFLLK